MTCTTTQDSKSDLIKSLCRNDKIDSDVDKEEITIPIENRNHQISPSSMFSCSIETSQTLFPSTEKVATPSIKRKAAFNANQKLRIL